MIYGFLISFTFVCDLYAGNYLLVRNDIKSIYLPQIIMEMFLVFLVYYHTVNLFHEVRYHQQDSFRLKVEKIPIDCLKSPHGFKQLKAIMILDKGRMKMFPPKF